MTDPVELERLMGLWRDHYVAMIQDGADPYDAADAMLQFSALMLEKLRGTPAASLALIAGADFMRDRAAARAKAEPTSEPNGGGLH